MERSDLVAKAVRLALATSMAGIVALSPSYAQDLRDDLAVQEKIVVTGSRIKRVDIEGPLPVTVIGREEIDASGEISVAEVLRSQTVNSFGSAKPRSGWDDGSQSQISMRGLGPGRTLVLVNGRRIANLGNGGSAANLAMIPLAAVERIEILRDGASAIYGTDAMAGVVNIILRRDYEGMHLGWEVGRPEQSGGDTDVYRLTGGTSGAKGNVTFGFEVNQQDIVFNRQREFTSQNLRIWGYPSTYQVIIAPSDPRNPTDDFVVRAYPDPRCPDAVQSDPAFPWSAQRGPTCPYADWGVSATEAEYDTKTFFVDTNYEINDRVEFFARGLASYNQTHGRYAPQPVTLSMPRDAPQNPTNPANPTNVQGDPFGGQSVAVDTDGDEVPDTTIDGPFALTAFYRNVPGGNRDYDFDDTLLDYLAGIRGALSILGGGDWELAAQWSEQRSDLEASGRALRPVLESAIEDGTFDIFSVFDSNSVDAIGRAASATGILDVTHRIAAADGQIVVDAIQLDNGPVAVALGFEYRDEDYDAQTDEQSSSGDLAGGLGSSSSGARVVKSLFTEAIVPILPDLEVNLAGRYDDYNDFGTTFNPKVSVAYRPLDSLLLRGNLGEGFRAPDMNQLYSPVYEGIDFAIDPYRCSMTDEDIDGDGSPDVDPDLLPTGHPCTTTSFLTLYSGNRDLDPETSRNWTVGFVWSPTATVTLMADYYDIQIDDEIVPAFGPSALSEEFTLRQAGATGNRVGRVVRTPAGFIEYVNLPEQNVASTDTNGVDVEASYAFGIGRFGDVSSVFRWTHVFEYVSDFNDGNGSIDVAGWFGRPEDRAQLTFNWALGDFAATVVSNYVSDQVNDDPRYRMDSRASFTTWDVQLAYTTPWNGNVTIGARNVFDRDPPQGEGGSGYDITQYEVYGRVPYIRIEQEF